MIFWALLSLICLDILKSWLGFFLDFFFHDDPELTQDFSHQHKPKMTMAHGRVLRSTRAGEKSRKASIVEFRLYRIPNKYNAIKSYVMDSSLSWTESDMVLVGMAESDFLSWAEGLEETYAESHSFVEFPLSGLPYLAGTYFREPGMSMSTSSAILVAMTREQLMD